jgi:cation diffusion facilitator family transporter
VALTPARALIGSILVTTVLGGLGIVWGLASGSQMILLDGVYAFIGVGVSWLLLRASKLTEQGPSHRYPYGLEAATPLVIGVQGVALLATLGYAMVGAVRAIVEGGSEVSAGIALAYAGISFVASVITLWWLRRGVGGSELIAAEAAAWRVAVWRGFGMLVGFAIMAALDGSSWSEASPYVDPVMVLVTCVLSLGVPIRMIRTTVIELLEGAPAMEIQRPVLERVDEVRREFDLPTPRVRMTKAGPKLYVEIDILVAPTVTIGQEDEVRRAFRDRLSTLGYELWLNVELTSDPHWAE